MTVYFGGFWGWGSAELQGCRISALPLPRFASGFVQMIPVSMWVVHALKTLSHLISGFRTFWVSFPIDYSIGSVSLKCIFLLQSIGKGGQKGLNPLISKGFSAQGERVLRMSLEHREAHVSRPAADGGFKRERGGGGLFLIWTHLSRFVLFSPSSRFVLFCPSWDFPLLLSLLKGRKRYIPQRVWDTIRTGPITKKRTALFWEPPRF